MSSVIALILLVGVLVIKHWFDAFHIIFSLVAVIPFFLCLYWVKKRTSDREKFFNEGRPKIEDLGMEAVKEGAGRPIVFGLLKGFALVLLCLLIFWIAGKTPVYGLFYNRGFEKTMSEIQVLEKANAYERICQVAEERLGKKLSLGKQRELAQKEYQAMVAWGNTLADSAARKERFSAGRDLAKKWNLDSQLAEAKLESEALSEKLLAPADLALGTVGAITQIDTSVFPPSIIVYISVEDVSGEPIEWLQSKDFALQHNDLPLTKFEIAPISELETANIILLMDVSGSTKGQPLACSQEGAQNFVAVMGPRDQIRVIAFNEEVNSISVWGDERDKVCKAIQQLKAGGDTAIYDSLDLALEELREKRGQKAIALFTDGKDTHSKKDLDSVLQKAISIKIPVYVLGLASRDLSPEVLRKIADDTRGCYLEAENYQELQALYRQIGEKIKKQYRLVFNPDIQTGQNSLSITVGRNNYLKLTRPYSMK